MNNDGNKILVAIKRMAADDNKGLRMTTTIVDVKDDPRGSIVGFGTEKVCGDDAFAQTMGLPGKYMACAFFYRSRRTEKIPLKDTNMKKKEIMIELVNDIPSLIRIQELSLIELKKTIRNQQVIDFQEDILRILKAVNKMDFINLDSN